jgi:TolB protein
VRYTVRMPRWSILLAACSAAPVAKTPPAFEVTSAPELVTPASSEYSEVRLAVSPDGNTMLWGSTNRPGGPGGWDIWVSARRDGAWSEPAPASFDGDANDFDPAFTADGRAVYFFSNRAGGLGGDDIYRAAVTPGGFGPVEHLDASINSAGNEWAPAPDRDGSLLFATDGRGGAGRHDLFVARPQGAGFAPAEPLPGAINTPADEFDATLLPDRSIVFSRSKNADEDPISLVFAHRTAAGYDAGTPLPLTINIDQGWTLGPAVDWTDPSILYFTGHRPEAKAGKLDVYRVRYRLRR